jgi:hypothetical protein
MHYRKGYIRALWAPILEATEVNDKFMNKRWIEQMIRDYAGGGQSVCSSERNLRTALLVGFRGCPKICLEGLARRATNGEVLGLEKSETR